MGNVIGRQEDAVDGGSVFPTGQVVGKTDSDLRVVRRYVLERRLAPFYVGKGDAVSASDVECPICFLYFPRAVNESRCCAQPICSVAMCGNGCGTDCFVQIKHPATGGAATCPYCMEPEFGVVYWGGASVSPASLAHRRSELAVGDDKATKRRASLPHYASVVVTVGTAKRCIQAGRHVSDAFLTPFLATVTDLRTPTASSPNASIQITCGPMHVVQRPDGLQARRATMGSAGSGARPPGPRPSEAHIARHASPAHIAPTAAALLGPATDIDELLAPSQLLRQWTRPVGTRLVEPAPVSSPSQQLRAARRSPQPPTQHPHSYSSGDRFPRRPANDPGRFPSMMELEEAMLMEAMRQSLADEEERQRQVAAATGDAGGAAGAPNETVQGGGGTSSSSSTSDADDDDDGEEEPAAAATVPSHRRASDSSDDSDQRSRSERRRDLLRAARPILPRSERPTTSAAALALFEDVDDDWW